MRLFFAHSILAPIAFISTTVTTVSAQALSTRIDNVPMYGHPEVVRSDELKVQDEIFIAEAIKGIGTREQASDAWRAQVERFLAKLNYDLAMRRYN